jgi:hypothetical protein
VERGGASDDPRSLDEVLTVEVGACRDPQPRHAVGDAGWPEAAHEDALRAQGERRRDRTVG